MISSLCFVNLCVYPSEYDDKHMTTIQLIYHIRSSVKFGITKPSVFLNILSRADATSCVCTAAVLLADALENKCLLLVYLYAGKPPQANHGTACRRLRLQRHYTHCHIHMHISTVIACGNYCR